MTPPSDASFLEILRAHARMVEDMEDLLPEVRAVAELLVSRLAAGATVYWLGNGGSAADSLHFSAELVGRFRRERRARASVALTADPAAITSIANDYGFSEVFARQVEGLCREGDVVVGISTSGRSPNVAEALRAARALGAHTVALTGRDGGDLRDLADHCLRVPADETARIQEGHLLIGHLLCDHVEASLSGGEE